MAKLRASKIEANVEKDMQARRSSLLERLKQHQSGDNGSGAPPGPDLRISERRGSSDDPSAGPSHIDSSRLGSPILSGQTSGAPSRQISLRLQMTLPRRGSRDGQGTTAQDLAGSPKSGVMSPVDLLLDGLHPANTFAAAAAQLGSGGNTHAYKWGKALSTSVKGSA